MAKRRMFSNHIVDTDAFLGMPDSSQLLYFHFAMRADDEGFVGSPKKIMRMCGFNEDDFKVVVAKRFILVFESGVVVIKHWLIHNTIRMDRFQETKYIDEKKQLKIKDNKAYTELGKPNGNQVATQVKLSKVKLSKYGGSETSPRSHSSVKKTNNPFVSSDRNLKHSSAKKNLAEPTYEPIDEPKLGCPQTKFKNEHRARQEKEPTFKKPELLESIWYWRDEYKRLHDVYLPTLDAPSGKVLRRFKEHSRYVKPDELTDWWFEGGGDYCGYKLDAFLSEATVNSYIAEKDKKDEPFFL